MLSHHVPMCGICSGALYDLERVLWILSDTGGGVTQSRKSEGCRWGWHATISRDVKSLVLLNIWFKDVIHLLYMLHMLYILGEFQALPINLRFPSQRLLTVNFSERETALRRDEQRLLVKRGTGGECCLGTFHCLQALALQPRGTLGLKVETHRLREAYLLTGEK